MNIQELKRRLLPYSGFMKPTEEGGGDSGGAPGATTEEELRTKFGDPMYKAEKIIVHNCWDKTSMINAGALPSGGDLVINKMAIEADLLIAEGFIEPHLFAGFSGGRKSVLPGIVSDVTVLANHCSEFIAHENARAGILAGNPLHEDMLYAAKQAKLAFILNVVIDAEKFCSFFLK